MNLLDRFIQFIEKENLFQKDDTLLLAVSGGVDSVALCELCNQAGFRFVIAHCNFRLRDKESERDEDFVNELAERYGVDFQIKKFATSEYAAANKLSIQEAARKLRYDWFEELTLRLPGIANSTIAKWILTAHHGDDNIETILLNFFRGTGIQGLRGILPRQGKIVRPLLLFRKDELKQFAADHHLTWVEDSSNQSDKYSRNYFRNSIIPHILTIYPEVEQNLLSNQLRFRDIEILYRQSVDRHKENLLEVKGNEIHIPILKLKKALPVITIIYEIIKDYGFASGHVQEVIKLMESETGKYIQSSTHQIIKNRKWLIIAPKASKQAANIVIDQTDSLILFEAGKLHVEILQATSTTTQYKEQSTSLQARLSALEIDFPLLLRKWKTGDYFYPLGMKKKKKLSRFFIDQKMSKAEKENVWILETNKKIIWVVGLRIDERFKIHPASTSILSITLER